MGWDLSAAVEWKQMYFMKERKKVCFLGQSSSRLTPGQRISKRKCSTVSVLEKGAGRGER